MRGTLARGLEQVDLFLSNSDFTWQRFIEANPRCAQARHATVALGVGVPEQRTIAPSTTPAAVMIGRMSKGEGYKGHEEVIRVWPRVSRSVPGAQLWIVGGGDAADELISLAAASEAADRIRFLGVVPEAEKDRLLGESRCLVLPSRGEGFGLVYLEAMRLGRPCLASVHDAGREVVGPPLAGLAASPENPDELADAIARLLTPGPEWDRWSQSARDRYESAFTAAHFQRRLREVIHGQVTA
jgi:phosphatidylinositol alpha-1,6-mannosyltransferase